MEAAAKKINTLSKPLGSLGRLEEYAIKLAGIRGYTGGKFDSKKIAVFAADNGVYAQNITPVPQEVTLIQAGNIAGGLAGVNVFARLAGAQVELYNVGMDGSFTGGIFLGTPVMPGTRDISIEPAMEPDELAGAMEIGASSVDGTDLLGVGEMGICNTTTASAVTACLLGASPDITTGRGAGITDEQLKRKTDVIKQAIEINSPDPDNAMDVIQKVGGLDIAAMTGAYLECEKKRVPVVIDGFISAAAALCAYRLSPGVKDFMFASHISTEPGFKLIMQELGLIPPINLNMRLGEGSGCPFMFFILEAALRFTDEMATFDESRINASGFVDIS